MAEKRKFIRISESLRISYQVTRSFRMVSSNLRNISEVGVCLPVLQRLQPKMMLDLEFYIDESGQPIKATAEVIWSKEVTDLKFPYIAGVKFITINLTSLNRLRAYIAKKSKDEPIGFIEKE